MSERRSFSRLALIGLTVLLLAAGPVPAQTGQSADAALRQLLDRQTADWNRGDVEAFMTGYDDSPQTAFVGQTVQYGYAAILARYRKLYATPAAMGQLRFSHLAIRVLDRDYASVTGNFHLERPEAGGGNADGIFSLLCSRTSRGWKIILDHTTKTG